MDFSTVILSFVASFFIFLRRVLHLIINPYTTMRKISQKTDWSEVIIIFSLVLLYFYAANSWREFPYEPALLFLFTVVHFILIVFYFYSLSQATHGQSNLRSFIATFAYSLIPTLVWFSVNSLLYLLLPPPRTPSFAGKSFSMVYLTFSVSILMWKMLLMYLAIRFSSKLSFYRIVYFFMIFVCIMVPYSILLYALKLFRIPFI